MFSPDEVAWSIAQHDASVSAAAVSVTSRLDDVMLQWRRLVDSRRRRWFVSDLAAH